jgi:hypothetical protein
MFDEKLGQGGQHVIRVEAPRNRDRQALAAELVNYCEHFERSPIDCAVGHEVVSPHVIRVLWPQPDTRTVIEPQPSAFRLFGRDFKPFTPPDALHPFAINPPAVGTQQRGDAAIAIAAKGTGQLNNRYRQRCFVVAHPVRLALGRARLTDGPASAPFRNTQPLSQMLYALTPAFRA